MRASRKTAILRKTKACLRCKAVKSTTEFRLHRGVIDRWANLCHDCQALRSDDTRIYRQRWKQANPHLVRASAERLRKEHPERAAVYADTWRQKHPERVKASEAKRYHGNTEFERQRSARWKAANTERIAIRAAAWQKANSERCAAISAKRRAFKLQATPLWRNEFFIREIYDLAKRRSELMGIKWHVDHIAPLNNDLVCGLHVEANLQVIPGKLNVSKSNRYWPGMP